MESAADGIEGAADGIESAADGLAWQDCMGVNPCPDLERAWWLT
jgi:hypothetical protein